MNRRRQRAFEALLDEIQTLRQIARSTSINDDTLAKWMQDPEFRAQLEAQIQLFDLWLRQSARQLLCDALRTLGRMLRSPNVAWKVKCRVVDIILRINARFPNVVINKCRHQYCHRSRYRNTDSNGGGPEENLASDASGHSDGSCTTTGARAARLEGPRLCQANDFCFGVSYAPLRDFAANSSDCCIDWSESCV
jgi:hypothetical protein